MSGAASIANIFPSVTANANVSDCTLSVAGTAQHNALALFILSQSANDIVSVTGSVNGAYTPVDAMVSSILNYQICTYYFEDIAGGAEDILIDLSFSATQYAAIGLELNNVKPSAFDGHIANAQGAILAGSNTLFTGSGGSSTPANAPSLMISCGFMFVGTLNPGNGLLVASYAGSASVGGRFCVQSQRLTASGVAQQASFSPTSNGSAGLSSLMIFDEIVAGAAGGNQSLTVMGA